MNKLVAILANRCLERHALANRGPMSPAQRKAMFAKKAQGGAQSSNPAPARQATTGMRLGGIDQSGAGPGRQMTDAEAIRYRRLNPGAAPGQPGFNPGKSIERPAPIAPPSGDWGTVLPGKGSMETMPIVAVGSNPGMVGGKMGWTPGAQGAPTDRNERKLPIKEIAPVTPGVQPPDNMVKPGVQPKPAVIYKPSVQPKQDMIYKPGVQPKQAQPVAALHSQPKPGTPAAKTKKAMLSTLMQGLKMGGFLKG